jgi:hypothetical protein
VRKKKTEFVGTALTKVRVSLSFKMKERYLETGMLLEVLMMSRPSRRQCSYLYLYTPVSVFEFLINCFGSSVGTLKGMPGRGGAFDLLHLSPPSAQSARKRWQSR